MNLLDGARREKRAKTDAGYQFPLEVIVVRRWRSFQTGANVIEVFNQQFARIQVPDGTARTICFDS